MQLRKSVLETRGPLLTHEQAIARINSWFTFSYIKTNIALASKYPYVFKNKSEIIAPLDEYKVLILPSPEFYSKQAVSAFKRIVLNDLHAEINEMNPLFNVQIDPKKGHSILKQLFERGNALMRANKNVQDSADVGMACDDTRVVERDGAKLGVKVGSKVGVKVGVKVNAKVGAKVCDNLIKVIDDVFAHVPNPQLFSSLESFIQAKIDEHVQYQDSFKAILMRGNVKLLSMLQGRNSIIRQSISRKLPAFRGQILHRPELAPNQVIFPYTWQVDLNVYAKKLVDIQSPYTIDPECFIKLDMRIGQKRDPAINANS